MKEFVDKVVEAMKISCSDDERKAMKLRDYWHVYNIQNITIQDSVVVDSVFTNSEEE